MADTSGIAIATIQLLETFKRHGWELVDPKAQALVEYTELRDAWKAVLGEAGVTGITFELAEPVEEPVGEPDPYVDLVEAVERLLKMMVSGDQRGDMANIAAMDVRQHVAVARAQLVADGRVPRPVVLDMAPRPLRALCRHGLTRAEHPDCEHVGYG